MTLAFRRFALLTVCLACGCYDYVPAHTAPTALIGRDVELALTDSGAVMVARAIGPASTAIDGAYLGDSAGHYLIAARLVRRRNADPTPWAGERLAVPRPFVSSVTVRTLSKRRTTLATLSVLGGIIGARFAIKGLGGSNTGKGGIGVERPPQ